MTPRSQLGSTLKQAAIEQVVDTAAELGAHRPTLLLLRDAS